MSQRRNIPGERNSMPHTDGSMQDASWESSSLPRRSEGGSFRRTAVPTSAGRASGELEGSTLGSSSRDGEQRAPGQRRINSSSGFLLDSLPRSTSLRIGSHRSRPSQSSTEKRSVPDGDIVVSKKRSRFPWSRHKDSASETGRATSVTTSKKSAR